MIVNRYSDDFNCYSGLADVGPLDDPEAQAMAIAVFDETQRRHQRQIETSGILTKIITDEAFSSIDRLCVYRASSRVGGWLMVCGGVKIIERPFLNPMRPSIYDGEYPGVIDGFALQPHAREQRIPVYATGVDGLQTVRDFEREDALLVASMVMELSLMQDEHRIPPLTEDLTEIDLR